MADVIVSCVVNQVLEKSTSLAAQDIAVLWGLKTDLRSIKNTFTQIQAVLKDAEARQRKSSDLQNWLRKVRAASFEVENVLEEVSTEALLRSLHVQRGIKNRVSTFFNASNPLKFRIRMVQKVKIIKERLDAIAAEKTKFDLEEGITSSDCDVGVVADLQSMPTNSIVNDSKIIGRDEEKEMIVEKICNGQDHDGVLVHAIWGIGGLGKTTLAKLVYKDPRVERRFDLKIWVCVSDDFSIERLIRAVVESIEGSLCNLSEMEPLLQRLRERLKRRRFFLVLDNIQNVQQEKWDGLREALSCGLRGSTIMVTSRSKKAADMMATSPALVHTLDCLSENDSWLLFEQRANVAERGQKRIELEAIGNVIVKRCQGLPLAVKALGSLMRLKSSRSEWLSVLNSEVWNFADEESDIFPALKLSYDHLPSYMRQCFSLCCIFPKECKMDKELLIELWVAYGFIPSRGDSDLYALGEEIFNTLVWRSFLQEVEEQTFDGTTTCKMHDLMHDLAQSVMKDECSHVVPGQELKFPEQVLHLSSHDVLYLSNQLTAKVKTLRSLISFGDFTRIPSLGCIFRQRYLRVLHLSSSYTLTDLPESIGNLKFLRYLNISHSEIDVLPKSIIQLQNLQILKLTHCGRLRELPDGMRYMRNLRHLNIHGCHSLVRMPIGMGKLRCLRRLSTFLVGREQGFQLSELQELNLLGGQLSIMGLKNVKDSTEAQRAHLKRKQNINCLSLSWGWMEKSSKNDSPANNSEEVLVALEPHSNLKMLTISNYNGLHFPNWMVSLVNLVGIVFESCEGCENLPPLWKLPCLRILELKQMGALRYLVEKESSPSRDSFPCLQKLIISDCPGLFELPNLPTLKSLQLCRCNEKVVRSVGKFTTLRVLEIEGFKEMKSLPDDIFSSLTSLEEFYLENCDSLESFPELKSCNSLKNLEKLKVEHCHSLTSVPSNWFQGTPNLRSLYVSDCSRLESLPGLQHLSALEALQLRSCPNLRCLPDGLHLKTLASLVIEDCEHVKRCEK